MLTIVALVSVMFLMADSKIVSLTCCHRYEVISITTDEQFIYAFLSTIGWNPSNFETPYTAKPGGAISVLIPAAPVRIEDPCSGVLPVVVCASTDS